ncbi:discoidin domain-containing protein [Thermomonas aquatica]|uniref:discoidin domain-containing protein n=1 Tax=Thermomonas aquatica TaxID=2202149 RepID=UPI003CCDC3CB
MKFRRALDVVCIGLALAAAGTAQAQDARLLDGFEDISAWKATASDSVSASLRQVDGAKGKALCLDYDFNGVSGYAVARRALPMRYPGNYEFRYYLRGEGPANNLEIKLADASGDNVWWRNQPNTVLPSRWTASKLKQRQIDFAWGPIADRTLRATESFELTISAGKGGGKGSACIDELSFRELPLDDGSPLTGVLSRSGDTWTYDLGRVREFGGAILRWSDRKPVADYAIELSDDGRSWRTLREVRGSNGGEDMIAMPDAEARWLRVRPIDATSAKLLGIAVQPLAFSATTNDFIKAIAARAPRGTFPRGFSGEQPYWTIVGIDGGTEQGLIGEDGAIELAKGAPSIEPFVLVGGKRVGWADVQAAQSLQDGYLPIPSVHWTHRDFRLDITAFADGEPADSNLVGRYRLTNTTRAPMEYTLQLALRPLQVNPPGQFLNTTGGVSPIEAVTAMANAIDADGRRILFSRDAAHIQVSTFTSRETPLVAPSWHSPPWVRDPDKLASAALEYTVKLAPGESFDVAWTSKLSGTAPLDASRAEDRQRAVAATWRDKLDRVRIKVPPQVQRVVDTLRTSLAHMLVSRTGPRLQPGTRSYARAWIRDGAMINEGLLRMGREDVAEDFLRWYAPYQFPSGKVPCCVDDRGSDPVPENDSQGELIYAIAEQYRYTRDRALLEAMWPHVAGAVKYMDELRLSERTEENRANNPAFYGLMPASISHEGYSAKPMHSYWDDFWALRGYKDAVEIAQWLGKADDAKRFAASRDQFRADLYASIDIATKQKGIDFIPGAAELGDFDATSTTIMLAPGGEQDALPQGLLHNTFERYWREFVQRRDGTREWKDYTPYELRTVGSFVRLGWRERAHEALAFFFKDRQPPAWNQWAEVVSRTPRTPFFLGDLPHAWVESDYVRSVLDMFAYTRESDDALVVATGIPADWLQGEGVAIEGLRTPQGALAYTLKAEGDVLRFDAPAGLRLPKGGLALSLPKPWATGNASSAGRAMPLHDGELRITTLPARIEIRLPR